MHQLYLNPNELPDESLHRFIPTTNKVGGDLIIRHRKTESELFIESECHLKALLFPEVKVESQALWEKTGTWNIKEYKELSKKKEFIDRDFQKPTMDPLSAILALLFQKNPEQKRKLQIRRKNKLHQYMLAPSDAQGAMKGPIFYELFDEDGDPVINHLQFLMDSRSGRLQEVLYRVWGLGPIGLRLVEK